LEATLFNFICTSVKFDRNRQLLVFGIVIYILD